MQRAVGNRAFGRLMRQPLPADVRYALQHPSNRALGAGERQRALEIAQAPTLEEAGVAAGHLPVAHLETMEIPRMHALSDEQRADWAVTQLGAQQGQLRASAVAHHVPMQLLATVILNELTDIHWTDQLDETWFGRAVRRGQGSLGIAQIEGPTAAQDHLVDLPSAPRRSRFDPLGAAHEYAQLVALEHRLTIPQFAIEAAAREVALLLRHMGEHLDRPWQAAFQPPWSWPQADVYSQLRMGSPSSRERQLARIVCAAYNSPGIIITHDLARYVGAITHGDNARRWSDILAIYGLFRTAQPPPE
jgi:hypothetical protein